MEFKGDKRIKELEIQSGEIQKRSKNDKPSILDIKAQSYAGDIFNVEMQAFERSFYPERALYYWAKLYSGQLKEGDPYEGLCNTYSVNFLDFRLIKELSNYKSNFLLLEKDNPKIQLTDRLQMVFFELPKFTKPIQKVSDNLELWLYTIKNATSLDEANMRTIVSKNPVMEKTFSTLKRLSIDPELVSEAAEREKALKDYNTGMLTSYKEGKAEGKAEKTATIIKNMLNENIATPQIARYTGLQLQRSKT